MAIWEINPMEGTRQVPTGIFSRSVSRRLFTHLECAKPHQRRGCPALIRRLVRNISTRSKMRTGSTFAPIVRTISSHFWFAPANAMLVRTWQAVTSAVSTNGYQIER